MTRQPSQGSDYNALGSADAASRSAGAPFVNVLDDVQAMAHPLPHPPPLLRASRSATAVPTASLVAPLGYAAPPSVPLPDAEGGEHMDTTLTTTVEPSRPLHRGAACLACRRKRAKCGGERPQCSRCVRTKADCVYEAAQKSTLTLLKERVDELEQRNRELERKQERTDLANAVASGIGPFNGFIASSGSTHSITPDAEPGEHPSFHTPGLPPHEEDWVKSEYGILPSSTPGAGPSNGHYPPSNSSAWNAHPYNGNPQPYPGTMRAPGSGLINTSHLTGGLPADPSTGVNFAIPHVRLDHRIPQPVIYDPSSLLTAYPEQTPLEREHDLQQEYFRRQEHLQQQQGRHVSAPTTYRTANFHDSSIAYNQNVGFYVPWTKETKPAALVVYQTRRMAQAKIPCDPAWWDHTTGQPSPDFQQRLIAVFLAHRRQCACELPIERFSKSLVSTNPKERPDPCFLNAIFLLACWFMYPYDVYAYESRFLERTRLNLMAAMGNGEKIINYLQGTTLLAVYYYGTGRMLEGYTQISTAAQLSMVAGLHQITSPVWRDLSAVTAAYLPRTLREWLGNFRGSPFLLTPPRDATELAERIHLFWGIWILEASGCTTHGLPSIFDTDREDAKITTPLPVSIDDYMNGNVSDESAQTLAMFWNARGVTPYKDNIFTLRIKCTAVMERAAKLATIWGSMAQPDVYDTPETPLRPDPTLDINFATQFENIDATASHLLSTLAPLKGSTADVSDITENDIQPDWWQARIDPRLVHIWMVTLSAIMQLHNIKAGFDDSSYNQCLIAADQMLEICALIQELDFRQLDLILGITWMSTSHILLRALDRARKNHNQERCALIERRMSLLHFVFHKLGQVYPLVDIQADKAEQALRDLP